MTISVVTHRPRLDGQPMIFLAQSAPLYGVHGTLYGYGPDGVMWLPNLTSPCPIGITTSPPLSPPN
jgi:hypothetical protein